MPHARANHLRTWIAPWIQAALLAGAGGSPARAFAPGTGGILENGGQVSSEALWYAPFRYGTVYFTPDAVVLEFVHAQHSVWLRLDGALHARGIEPRAVRVTRVHCFRGADPAGWRRNLRVCDEIVYRFSRPGVEVCFRVEAHALRYRMVGLPGAVDRSPPFRFEGADVRTAHGADTLEIRIPGQMLWDEAIAAGAAERVLRWDDDLPHAGILPAVRDAPGTLAWSTLLGGADNEYAHGLAVDSQDRPIVAGYTRSANFPVTPGACDSVQSGSYDLFVAQFDAQGSSLLWATFIGGGLEDRPFAVALDRADNVVVTGHSYSPDYPTTPGAWDRVLDGTRDVFVTKLSATGSELLWSTYLGGSGWESGWGLAIDAGDRPVVAGETASRNYPTTADAFDATLAGGWDGFVSVLDATGSHLASSTFLGGSSTDRILGVALDPHQRIVVGGTTYSANFPVGASAFDTTHNGGWDGFVARLDGQCHTLVSSTFLGGSGTDVPYAVRANADADAVVAGSTASSDLPVTPGAFDVTYNGGGDTFVSQIDSGGAVLRWCTYVGGSALEEAFALVLDRDDRPLISGETASADFPTSWDGFDRVYSGNQDAFVVRLDASGQSLSWGSYLGGREWDSGWDFALDRAGNPLLAGPTRSSDFPTTEGAYDRSYNGGGEDAYLVRFTLSPISDSEGIGSRPLVLWAAPNPFHDAVQLGCRLEQYSTVKLEVFDAAGRRVAQVASSGLPAGTHAIPWSGRDAGGRRVPGGVYWLRLTAGDRAAQTKVVRVTGSSPAGR